VPTAELIPLPRGSDFFTLPGRRPIGHEPRTMRPVVLDEWLGESVQPVAAFLSPAHTGCHHVAYETRAGAPDSPRIFKGMA